MNVYSFFRENKEYWVLVFKDFKDEDFDVVIKWLVFCFKDFYERKVFKFYCKVC